MKTVTLRQHRFKRDANARDPEIASIKLRLASAKRPATMGAPVTLPKISGPTLAEIEAKYGK
jgi:hypothetical protein